MSEAIQTRDGSADAVHLRLMKAVEKRQSAYLWVPADAIKFTPRVLPTIYGDGRALFAIATINQRPAYWIIRACSTWGCDTDTKHSDGFDFGDATDDILTELEEQFGNGRCSYSGNNLFFPKKYRIKDCQCEECSDGRFRARWPMVDGSGGCGWRRMSWPEGFPTVAHPLHWSSNILDGREHNEVLHGWPSPEGDAPK